jgi:microcin C transport system permease protein
MLLVIPTFLGITLLVFTLTRLVPGGPIERMMTEMQLAQEGVPALQQGPERGGVLNEAQLASLKAYYGFDQPIFQAYLNWIGNVLRLDLGVSTRYNESVWPIIAERLPVSLYYGITTLILTYLICIPLGIAKALKHGQRFDHTSSALVFIGYAVPGYIVGIALLTAFAAELEWFPLGGFVSERYDEFTPIEKVKDVIWHSILPLISYMLGSFAVMTFMMKNSLMDQLAQDYVRTALAKGLSFKDAVWKHAVRNSLIPLATHFGNNISVILSGSFLIETVFNINGFGLLGYESLLERDYPVVMGILVISSLLFLIGNILSDLCVAAVDPRVRFE